MVEDLKEYAPCGILIHYTVDTDTDFVTYTDINGRGEYKLCKECEGCTWNAICRPTECNYMKIISDKLGRAVKPLDVITQIYEQAAAGYESEIVQLSDGTVRMRVIKQQQFEMGEKEHGGQREI